MRRRVMIAIGLIALVVALVRHPSADIRVAMHEAGDPAPKRIEAAIDMGVFAFSVIVTWTARQASLMR